MLFSNFSNTIFTLLSYWAKNLLIQIISITTFSTKKDYICRNVYRINVDYKFPSYAEFPETLFVSAASFQSYKAVLGHKMRRGPQRKDRGSNSEDGEVDEAYAVNDHGCELPIRDNVCVGIIFSEPGRDDLQFAQYCS